MVGSEIGEELGQNLKDMECQLGSYGSTCRQWEAVQGADVFTWCSGEHLEGFGEDGLE